MTVSTKTKSKFKSFKFKAATQIDAKFKTSPTAGISGNSNCQAYPPMPPPPPTEEPCAPSYKSGQQITPNPDRNCKEGNPNSSPGATKKYPRIPRTLGAKANADDDDKLDGEQQKDRAFDGERSRRTKRSSDASAVANVDAGSGSRYKQEKLAPPQISC
ncbi:hypothetical protein KR200_004480 [Drosophila serrata]|nr:hypothetical protein KR200_004480 [Drosophila serrata]